MNGESWIESIEKRALAPDWDFQEWIAQRKHGVTATEAASLCLGRQLPSTLAILKRYQPVPTDNTAVEENAYLLWGKARELSVAEYVTGLYPEMKHESRLFFSELNERYLASPDMIGYVDGEPALCEIKTSSRAVIPGGDLFRDSGYYQQMQWQMLVLGVDKCLYALEQHTDFDASTVERNTWMIHCDKDVQARLIKLADATLRELDELG